MTATSEMDDGTFAVTVNGGIHAELLERRGQPPLENEIAGVLDRLDGACH